MKQIIRDLEELNMKENFDVLQEIAFRLVHEGHTPECAVNMVHNHDSCTCPLDSGDYDPTDYLTDEEWQQITGGRI